jgi:hypothetical protein
MNTRAKRSAQNSPESSFESTLEETLKALHKRRSEIIHLLRSLEAERSRGFEQPLKMGGTSEKKDRSARVSRGHQSPHSSTKSDSPSERRARGVGASI